MKVLEKNKTIKKNIYSENNSNKNRIEYFDIAKGIGIILMIIGHCGIKNKYILNFIYSFHMPLFFIISGYFFKYKEDKECLKKNFKKLIIPYIITCIVIILYKVFTLFFEGKYIYILNTLKIWCITVLYGSGDSQKFGILSIGAIWFLLALFSANYIVNTTHRTKYQFFWILLIAYIGYKTSQYIWLPLSIQAGMVASIFVYMGTLAKRYDIFNREVPIMLEVLAIFMFVFCIIYCGKLYMVSNTYKNGFMDIIGALSGTYLCIKFSQFVNKYLKITKKILIFIGKNSLICLCLHLFSLDCLHYRNLHVIIKNMGIQIVSIRMIILNISFVAITLLMIIGIRKLFEKIKEKKMKSIII